MKTRFLLLIALLSVLLGGCTSSGPPGLVTQEATATPSDRADHLVISEVMAGVDGNNLYDFIELHNPTDAIIDLKGYALWYLLKDGDEETLVHVWDEPTLVPPHGFYLVGQDGQDFGVVTDLVVNQPLQPQRGGLILKDPGREAVDRLGWGEAPQAAVEGQAAESLENGVSLERMPGETAGNGRDTDNNAADFHVNSVPNPQNTGSKPQPIGDGTLDFHVSAPESVSPGEALQYKLEAANGTGVGLEDLVARLDIPEKFEITSMDEGIQMEGRTAVWSLSELGAGESKTASINLQAPLTYTSLRTHSYYLQAGNWPQPSFGPPLTVNIEGGSIPIETARRLIDQEVVIEGVATMYTGGFYAGSGAKFYLSDDTGGVQVYVAGAGNTLRVDIGDRVRVQGIVQPYRAAIEVVPANEGQVEILETNTKPVEPTSVTLAEIVTQSEQMRGDLVKVEGTLARVEEFSYSFELDLVDQDGKLVTAYLDKETGMTVETISSGQRYQVTGIIEALDNYTLLYPRQQSDLVQIYPETVLVTVAAPVSIDPGESFEVRYLVTNHTTSAVSDAVLTAAVPSGLTIETIGQAGIRTGDQITWQIDELPGNGQTEEVSFTAFALPGVSTVTIEGYSVTAPVLSTPVTGEPTYTFTGGLVPIWAIQGPGFRSPYSQLTVETVGVVTGVFPELDGFWIQESITDSDNATSAGLFVDTGINQAEVAVGDSVSVKGVVREFYEQTQLTVGTVTHLEVLSQGNPLPAPVVLDPPADEAASDRYFESLEGMRVVVSEPAVVVAPTNRYGEFAVVLADHGRERLYRGEENGIIIMADDGSSVVHEDQSTLAYAVSNSDLVTNLSGPLAYTFGNYKIEPVTAPEIIASDLEVPPPVRLAEGQYSIMTWNVENLFDVRDPHPSSPPLPTVSEYRQQITKVAETILAAGLPTVIGMQEVENIGVLEDIAEHELLSAYVYLPVLIEGTDSRGIDVGYLVRGDQAEVVEQVQYPAPEGITSRPPLLVKVRLIDSDTILYLLNNHFTSMSGGEAATEPRRAAQAEWNVSVMEELLAQDPGALLAVIGDLNSFYDSLPIDVLRDAGLVHVLERLPESERYTYVYEGVSQTLDHILVTDRLDALVDEVVVLHVNADYAIAPQGDTSAIKKSDHDPVIVIITPE